MLLQFISLRLDAVSSLVKKKLILIAKNPRSRCLYTFLFIPTSKCLYGFNTGPKTTAEKIRIVVNITINNFFPKTNIHNTYSLTQRIILIM